MVITRTLFAVSSRGYQISAIVEQNIVGGRDGYSITITDVPSGRRVGMVWRLTLAEAIDYALRSVREI